MFKILSIKYLHIFILSKFGIMKGFATFEIPVAPHVRKYLIHKFGDSYEVSQLDLLGMMIIPLLSKPLKVCRIEKKSLTDSNKSTLYTVSISYEYFERQGFYLEVDQLKLIGRACDKYFREMLFAHVSVNSRTQPKQRMKSIIDFCEAHGISVEDIDPRTLYRNFYRKKEGEPASSPPNPAVILN